MSGAGTNANRKPYQWLLWWMINHDELDRHAADYQKIGFFQSARAIAVYCLAFSTVLTGAFVYFGQVETGALVDAGVFVFLALFIAFGQRWAMILAMIIWTFEKVFIAIFGLGSIMAGGSTIVMQLMWWGFYMHAFYFALRVENERRKVEKEAKERARDEESVPVGKAWRETASRASAHPQGFGRRAPEAR